MRPRFDITKEEKADGTSTKTNVYYLYRAKLNLAADIGEGWHFHTTLAHNGLAMWAGKFGEGDVPNDASLETAGRASVDFMYLYFGRKTNLWGFDAGIIPFNGMKKPQLDLHFYPNKMVDIPYTIFNNNGTHGFCGFYKLGQGKLNALISVDDNLGYKKEFEPEDGNTETMNDTKDQYSLYLDYAAKISNFTIQPMLIKTIADENNAAPLTFGANITTPKFSGFRFIASFGYSSQTVKEAGEYKAWLFRAKAIGPAGPGKITAWFDLAKRTDKVEGSDDIDTDFWYTWISYKLMVYKSDKGSVSFSPTIRIANKTEPADNDKDNIYRRTKIELTSEITF